MSDLGDVFSDAPMGQETVEEVSEPTSEEAEEVETGETEEQSEEVAEEESEEDESEEESTKDPKLNAAIAQARDERAKRQKLEQELKELREAKQEAPKLPDVFENQEEFAKAIQEQTNQAVYQAELRISQEMMRDRYEDYDEVEAIFLKEVESNPFLMAKAKEAPNLAKFAYEQGKKFLKLKEMEDTTAYEAKLKAKLKAELLAEMENSKKAEDEKAEKLSPSLANARSANVSDSKGIDSLEDVFA